MRRLGEWVTALRNKWKDPFTKSELNIILLQVAFAGLVILITYLFFGYLYDNLTKTLIAEIMVSLSSDAPGNVGATENSLEAIKLDNFRLFSAAIGTLTIFFLFLVTRIIFKPAKLAMNSQKRFISDIAHELRTPLAIIKTNSEVAKMENNLDKDTMKMIEDNIDELDRISQIINNILSFNNLVRPERVQFSNINMGEVIDASVEKLINLADKKELEVIVKKVSPTTVWGNSVALEQVISNLLKNSINYTPNNGRITIRVGPDYYGNVLTHIEDTGEGIGKKDLMHIFEPFYKVEKSRNRKMSSSGLGLTIVSELVKMHRGRVTIKSRENVGTVAIVAIPSGRDVDGAEQIDLSKLNEVSINFLKGGNGN